MMQKALKILLNIPVVKRYGLKVVVMVAMVNHTLMLEEFELNLNIGRK